MKHLVMEGVMNKHLFIIQICKFLYIQLDDYHIKRIIDMSLEIHNFFNLQKILTSGLLASTFLQKGFVHRQLERLKGTKLFYGFGKGTWLHFSTFKINKSVSQSHKRTCVTAEQSHFTTG